METGEIKLRYVHDQSGAAVLRARSDPPPAGMMMTGAMQRK